MTYKNIKTGFMFDTPCDLKGADWIKVESAPIIVKEEKEKKPVKKKVTKE
ncbi:MAG: hypothetical protein Q4A15_00460 [Prevotellaceae bacterium]|nr:hypothetical protein [Prevotellaceae bacterium]